MLKSWYVLIAMKKIVYSNIPKTNMDVVFRSMLEQVSTMEGNLCVTM